MNFSKRTFAALLILLGLSSSLVAQPNKGQIVVADGDVKVTREEFEAILSMTPDKMRNLAASDLGDRLEVINAVLQTRKMAAAADSLSSDVPGYWELQFQILATKRQFIFDREVGEYSVPDVQGLAMEYYETQKDKYATKPELRKSSHILFASAPGLPRDDVRAKAQDVLDELRAGADFEEMVERYSDDPSSKARGGELTSWMRFGDPNFTPPYSEALFSIEEKGGYSEITDSPFGIHIVRLNDIEEAGYYSFDEVKDKIFNDIVAEYRSLAAKDVNARYGISDDAFIDGDAMEELFAPYKGDD